MSVIYKAEIKLSSAETSRDILLERQFPSFKQDGIQLLLFPYIPHRNSNSVFGYNTRMLLLQGAYKQQKTDRTGSGFGNGTAGHIRFICQIMRIRFLLGYIIPKRITDGMCQCTLAPFRFVYDTGFRCYRQIIDSSKT